MGSAVEKKFLSLFIVPGIIGLLIPDLVSLETWHIVLFMGLAVALILIIADVTRNVALGIIVGAPMFMFFLGYTLRSVLIEAQRSLEAIAASWIGALIIIIILSVGFYSLMSKTE